MYHTYNPSTDTLEVGTKIRLAGREGEIVNLVRTPFTYLVRFNEKTTLDKESFILNTTLFPVFEIADKPPLTIDKRVKAELGNLLSQVHVSFIDDNTIEVEGADAVLDYLKSLEEC